MGPQHIGAENRSTVGKQDGILVGLQWGRSTSLRKTTRTRYVNTLREPLQWGRSTSLRKTSARAGRGEYQRAGFNGAAAHRCGKPCTKPQRFYS